MKMDKSAVVHPLSWSVAEKEGLSPEQKDAMETALRQPSARFVMAITDFFAELPNVREIASAYATWRTKQALGRLSDGLLQDIGLERDGLGNYRFIDDHDAVEAAPKSKLDWTYRKAA